METNVSKDNKLCTLHLNDGIPNNVEYAGMTWAEYNEYDAHRRKLNREGKEHNLSVDMNLSKTYRNIIAANTTEHLANTTGIRDAMPIVKTNSILQPLFQI